MPWTDVVRWFRNASSATQDPSMRALANGMLELTKQVRRMDRKLDGLEKKLDGLIEETLNEDNEREPTTPDARVGLM